jgi:hypothetical protein
MNNSRPAVFAFALAPFSLSLSLASLPSFASDFKGESLQVLMSEDSIRIPGYGVVCEDPAGAAVHMFPLDEEPSDAALQKMDQRDSGRVAITLTSGNRVKVSDEVHVAKRTVAKDGAETYLFFDWLNPDETARLVLPQAGDLHRAYFVFDFDPGEAYQMPRQLVVCQLN